MDCLQAELRKQSFWAMILDGAGRGQVWTMGRVGGAAGCSLLRGC